LERNWRQWKGERTRGQRTMETIKEERTRGQRTMETIKEEEEEIEQENLGLRE